MTSSNNLGSDESISVNETADDSINRSIIDSLRKLLVDDADDSIAEILDAFLQDAPIKLERMNKAVESGDAKELERVSHNLKGSSGSLGAMRMSNLCGEIEQISHKETISEAKATLNRLKAEFERVQEFLLEERNK